MTTTTKQAAPTADGLEAQAQERLAEWWRRADRPPFYPASTDDVVELMRALEYEATVKTVVEFIDKGYIPPPVERDGRLKWAAADITAFAVALEFRRRWQKFSPIHNPKKSSSQRGREIAESQGIAAGVFHDLDRFTEEDLLLLMVEADDRNIREAFMTALQCKREGNPHDD